MDTARKRIFILFLISFFVSEPLHAAESNPDVYLDVPELITKYGFPVETHIIETEDGYLLTLHRIPHGRAEAEGGGNGNDSGDNNTTGSINGGGGSVRQQNQVMPRAPVLMLHGLLSSSSCWIMGAPEKAPAYIIADAGYDVWLGNVRGSKYSRNHTSLDPDGEDGKFWDFSFDEMGYYDVPAMIDYVLNKTGHAKLFYVGHSMGTTIFFAGMSSRPAYNDKVKVMFGLGPVATVKHILSPIRFLAPFTHELRFLLDFLGKYEFLPNNEFYVRWVEKVCTQMRYMELMCMNSVFLLTGFDEAQFNLTWLPVILAKNPAGTSVRTVAHFAQGVESGRFQHFDFGSKENLERYNQSEPPVYDLSKVVAPIGLFWAVNDFLADPEDETLLAETLPNVVHDIRIPLASFNHIDFVWGIDVGKLVVRLLLKYMPFY